MKEWTPPSRFEKFLYLVGTVILPALLFYITTYNVLLSDPWQSGESEIWVGLFLSPPVSYYFTPWLLYGMGCMLLLLKSPKQMSHLMRIRFGIYTGAVLALQYLLAVFLYLLPIGGTLYYGKLRDSLMIIGLMLIGGTAVLLLPKLWQGTANWLGGKGLIGLIVVTIILIGFGGGVIILWVTPVACLVLASKMSWQLWQTFDQPFYLSTKRLFAGLGWLAGYIASWQFAISKTVELYNELPTEPYGCYVVTAATHGHAQVVGRVDGVTPQLQRLKCGELVFMTMAPRWHRRVRRVYDVVGPKLARQVRRSAYLADLTYLLLKPLEWVVLLLLRLLLPNSQQLIQKLYRS